MGGDRGARLPGLGACSVSFLLLPSTATNRHQLPRFPAGFPTGFSVRFQNEELTRRSSVSTSPSGLKQEPSRKLLFTVSPLSELGSAVRGNPTVPSARGPPDGTTSALETVSALIPQGPDELCLSLRSPSLLPSPPPPLRAVSTCQIRPSHHPPRQAFVMWTTQRFYQEDYLLIEHGALVLVCTVSQLFMWGTFFLTWASNPG